MFGLGAFNTSTFEMVLVYLYHEQAATELEVEAATRASNGLIKESR